MDAFGTACNAANLIYTLAQYSAAVVKAREDIEKLKTKLKPLSAVLCLIGEASAASRSRPLQLTDEFRDSLQQCNDGLQELGLRLQPKRSSSHVGNVIQRARQKLEWPLRSDDIEKEVSKLDGYLASFNAVIALDHRSITTELERKIDKIDLRAEEEALKKQLNPVIEATANANKVNQRHRECLLDTRDEIRQDLVAWAGERARPIFWLSGMAGTGKSTIALTCARALRRTHIVGSFFFERGGGSLASPTRLLPTIAYQLATYSPQMREYICAAIKEEPDIAESSVNRQLNKLLLQPLRERKKRGECGQRLLLVIDALDECEKPAELKNVIQTLGNCTDLLQLDISILLTSRPETVIQRGFRDIPNFLHREMALHEQDQTTVDQDITTYVTVELSRIALDRDLGEEWPKAGVIETLARMSAGLFIFAATACRYIDGPHGTSPSRRLEQVMKATPSKHKLTQKLDKMYSTVIDSLFLDADEYEADELGELIEQSQNVLASVLLAFDNLSTHALSKLLTNHDISEVSVRETLDQLSAVIHVSRDQTHMVRIIHQSFRDFVIDPERCTEARLKINIRQSHERLGMGCLQVMRDMLREDGCGLHSSAVRVADVSAQKINDSLPLVLRYACRFWIAHLEAAGTGTSHHNEVQSFFETYALMWLEVMGLLEMISDAIMALDSLERCVDRQASPELSAFVHDLQRFTLSFQGGIREAPLQVYVCANHFAPRNSKVRQIEQHSSRLPFTVQATSTADWDARHATLDHSVAQAIFSPDGSTVASTGTSNASLWETATGRCVAELLNPAGDGQNAYAYDVSFSHNGRYVATAHELGVAQVWSAASGELHQLLEDQESLGHDNIVRVLFLFDDSVLITGSWQGQVCLWDVTTGRLRHALNVEWSFMHDGSGTTTLACSAVDGALAFTTKRSEITVWNGVTGQNIHVIRGHNAVIRYLVFPAQKKSDLVSASCDGALRVWDVWTGQLLRSFNVEGAQITSNDGISSGSRSRSISNSNSEFRSRSSGNGDTDEHAASDGYARTRFRYRSESGDDVESNDSDNFIDDRDISRIPFSLTLSHNGTLLAFVPKKSPPGPQIWNLETGECKELVWNRGILYLQKYCRIHFPLRFSPDGSLLALMRQDAMIEIVNLVTEQIQIVLSGLSDCFDEKGLIDFGPNSSLVLTIGSDRYLRIWDMETATAEGAMPNADAERDALQLTYRRNTLVALSPDGTVAVTGRLDGTIDFVDLNTRSQSLIVRYGEPPWIRGLAISGDAAMLAVVLIDEDARVAVQLVDTHDGNVIKRLEVTDMILSLAFSPDGATIAFAMGTDLQLWNVSTGHCLSTIIHRQLVAWPLTAHAWPRGVVFSSDGSAINLVPEFGRGEPFRMWDLNDGSQRSELKTVRQFAEDQAEAEGAFCGERYHQPFSLQGEWLCLMGRRALWLPDTYRTGEGFGSTFAQSDRVALIGGQAGNLTIVRLAPDESILTLMATGN